MDILFLSKPFPAVWGAVNQVFHGVSCVLGLSQSAAERSNFWRVFTTTFQGGMVYHTILV